MTHEETGFLALANPPGKKVSLMCKISAIILLVIVGLAAGAVYYALKRADVHHYKERRDWKDRSIVAIRNDLKKPNYLERRFGEIPKAKGVFETDDGRWKTADTIVCGDASWLAYRSQCHKADPKVHDIFIAKASDGKWYYSDFHFCIDLMVLDEQPGSIEDFKHRYFLVEFDGASDDALDPTWNVGDR